MDKTPKPSPPNRHYKVHRCAPTKTFRKVQLDQFPHLKRAKWLAEPDMSGETLYYVDGKWKDVFELFR